MNNIIEILKALLPPTIYLLVAFCVLGLSIYFELSRLTFTLLNSTAFCFCLYVGGLINKYMGRFLAFAAGILFIVSIIQGKNHSSSLTEVSLVQSGTFYESVDLFWVFSISAVFVFIACALNKKHSNQAIKADEK